MCHRFRSGELYAVATTVNSRPPDGSLVSAFTAGLAGFACATGV